MRFGDLTAHDGDHIGMPFRQDRLCIVGCFDPGFGGHECLAQGRAIDGCVRRPEFHVELETRYDLGKVVQIAAGPTRDVVDQIPVFQMLHERDLVFDA